MMKSLAPMTSMFTKTQNQKREATFYARTMNNRANSANTAASVAGERVESGGRERHQLAASRNTDSFENVPKSCRQRDADNTERAFAMLYRELENTKIKSNTVFALAKCLRIASRIQNGDNVPLRDDKFLYEHYPNLHLNAWMMRRFKEDPEDYASELKDGDGGDRSGAGRGVNITVMAGSASFDFSGTAAVSAPEINIC
ncbi:MAG: hypothetical protein LBC86_07600 [Oscillospiraceae bacterium]|jgi:hypothetical protein|nr:hypothetical protein [Oscillospiraceae bacterium]